ncbi:MAG: undecaprenyl-phosphate glucose phosphotransferase [Bacteroidetes bacterium]|nr:MAG: undecaprenyl-phosphate glucose phosphotransferase [Bacteroidota bacterium]
MKNQPAPYAQIILRALSVGVELVTVFLTGVLAYWVRFKTFDIPQEYMAFFGIYTFAWVGISLFYEQYNKDRLLEISTYWKRFLPVLLMQALVVFAYLTLAKMDISRYVLFFTYAITLLLLIPVRFLMVRAYRSYHNMTYSIRKIVVVGAGESADHLYDFFKGKKAKVFRMLATPEVPMDSPEYHDYLWDQIDELEALCMEQGIKEIYFAMPYHYGDIIQHLDSFGADNFIYFRVISDFRAVNQRQVNVDFVDNVLVLSLKKEPLRLMSNRILKRGFDLVFSTFVLTFIFPIIYLIVGAAIKLDSKGPIFYKQLRTGREGKEILVYKFRSMSVTENSDEFKQATKNDSRITKVGAFLRKSSLDEFPQFINVFLGQMSVVGPRPHPLKLTEKYTPHINQYLYRHFITPGITGFAQVNGYRGETSDPEAMEKRVEYDSWYIENWNLLLDLRIVFLTVWNAIRGEENAY